MQIKKISEQPVFTPIKVEITVESEQELTALNIMCNCSTHIPNITCPGDSTLWAITNHFLKTLKGQLNG